MSARASNPHALAQVWLFIVAPLIGAGVAGVLFKRGGALAAEDVIPFILFNWRTPLPWEWFSLLMCGVLTQVGQVCLTKSLQSERIAKVAVLNYFGLVYALIFSVTIFGERYTTQTVLGIALVVAGVLLAVLYGKPRPLEVIEEVETAVV